MVGLRREVEVGAEDESAVRLLGERAGEMAVAWTAFGGEGWMVVVTYGRWAIASGGSVGRDSFRLMFVLGGACSV